MDKLLLNLLALLSGLLIGWLFSRRWRPFLFESWRGLFLLIPAIAASPLFFFAMQRWPERIMTQGTALLMSLALSRFLIWSLFLLLNALPNHLFSRTKRAGLNPLQKFLLLPLFVGMAGETAVLLLNRGIWQVPESLLIRSVSPAIAAGIQNNAYVFLRISSPETHLPWLGQIWLLPEWLSGFSTLPTISPAETLTALSFLLIGISQFFPLKAQKSTQTKPNEIKSHE